VEKYNKKYMLINIMLKCHISKIWKNLKELNNKKKTETEKEKIKKVIANRHRSQSPLLLDDIFIKIK
tara:strand:+ start:1961 stop:2161 length:201 start_codon:yes stop_codon:yes gene_type:complete